MTPFRDEILVAYADGELSEEMRQAVDQVIKTDIETLRTVWMFERTRDYVRRAFFELDFKAARPWTKRLGQNSGKSSAAALWRIAKPFHVLPIAACALLAVLAGRMHFQGEGSADALTALGPLTPSSRLNDAFDRISVSGAEVQLPRDRRLVAIASFQDRFGQDCREAELYDAVSHSIPAQLIVACRSQAQFWSIMGAVSINVPSSRIRATYVPSEEQARTALDSVVQMLGGQHRTTSADRKILTP